MKAYSSGGGKGKVTGDKKIGNLQKPPARPKVGGISTPFHNKIASVGGKR